jgi:hypothetical protein
MFDKLRFGRCRQDRPRAIDGKWRPGCTPIHSGRCAVGPLKSRAGDCAALNAGRVRAHLPLSGTPPGLSHKLPELSVLARRRRSRARSRRPAPSYLVCSVMLSSRDEFYLEYGAAMAAWSQLESELCTVFAMFMGIQSAHATSIFYSVNAFDARAAIFKSSIPHAKVSELEKTLFEELISKARKLGSGLITSS